MMKYRNRPPALMLAFLTIPSLWIVLEGAQHEPYVALIKYDAFTQIGVACSLIAGWILFAIWLASQLRRRQLSPAWAAALLWTLIMLSYLQASPRGYLSDLAQFHGAT